MSAPPERRAIAAATLCVAAAVELLRFSREGGLAQRAFDPLGEDPIALLASALRMTIEIEDPFLAKLVGEGPLEERETGQQLSAAIAKWQYDAGAEQVEVSQ